MVKFVSPTTAIVLTTIFLGCCVKTSQQVVAQSLSIKQKECEPIGRVLRSEERNLPAGTLFCKGDRRSITPGARASVLCFNGKVLSLPGSNAECVARIQRNRPCSAGNRRYCPKPKGPNDVNSPALISPSGSALLNDRPLLSWYAILGATSYTVQVSGEGVSWQKTVKSTALPYPNEQPAMQFGNAYKITILANQGGSSVSPSESVVNLLPESDARQVKNTVSRINSLKLPKDEVAFLDLNAIYMSKNLLNEIISVLKARVKAGSENPAIYRVLGDRYLEAGLPDFAKQQYEVATTLAKKADNSAELAKAQAGLKRTELYSQLPRRINGAQ